MISTSRVIYADFAKLYFNSIEFENRLQTLVNDINYLEVLSLRFCFRPSSRHKAKRECLSVLLTPDT